MGTDKAFLEWQGRTLLAHAMQILSDITPDVRILGARQKFEKYGQVVEDEYADHGPLAGIHAALRAGASVLNLVLAVDMPLVETRFLQYLVQEAGKCGATVTLPRAGGVWQPLCAVYRPSFAALVEPALLQNRNKIDALFAATEVRILEEAELFEARILARYFSEPQYAGRAAAHASQSERSRSADADLTMPDNPPLTPYIDFQHVSKAFGDNRVLDDVSFNVRAGETVCILGRSGVGKSVSLHHIMGFLKPDAGRVIVAREDITEYNEEQLEAVRKKVTMVFQNGALFDSLTVGENVAFPLASAGISRRTRSFRSSTACLRWWALPT